MLNEAKQVILVIFCASEYLPFPLPYFVLALHTLEKCSFGQRWASATSGVAFWLTFVLYVKSIGLVKNFKLVRNMSEEFYINPSEINHIFEFYHK